METEIREQIIRHLLGELSLADLEAWLIESTWDRDDPSTDLAYSLQLLLAERTQGHRDDAAVERALRNALSTARLGAVPLVATATSAITEKAARWGQNQFAVADRRSVPARA
jgi:hypothetical protein